jgi:hypothetical protein
MKKVTLTSFINKYSLNGNIESVKWDIADNKISTSSISDDKNVLSFVEIKDSGGLDTSELGVNDTSKLQKLIGVLGDDVEISFNKHKDRIVSINLSSEDTNVQYVTADLSVIPSVPALKKLPPFNFEIKLTKEFVSKFVKAKTALNDIDTFTLIKNKKGKGKVKLVIGYSTVNSNRISLDVTPEEGKDTLSENIHFSAKFLKEILTSNSECENAVLKVSDSGLAHVEFDDENFNSNYYLVAIKNID